MMESGENLKISDLQSGDAGDPHEGAHSANRCVVIIPSAESERWITEIRSAASANGLHAVVVDGQSSALPDPADHAIIITHDPMLVCGLANCHFAVIAVDLETSPAEVSRTFHIAAPEATRVASALLANTWVLPKETFWVSDSTRPEHGELILFPGFKIRAPEPRVLSGHAEAPLPINEAFSIFADGPPAVGAQARWSQELFSYDHRRIAERTHIYDMDITGPARALLFGPYVSLPPGAWRASVRFTVDEDAATHRYRFEWGTPRENGYVSVLCRPGTSGIFELALDYDWTEVAPAEFRIILTQGSLGGEFSFLGMVVERTG